MMDLAHELFFGLAAGVVVAVTGAIKDSPHEGFSTKKFARSPAIAFMEAPFLAELMNIDSLPILFFVTVAMERLTTEIYKTLGSLFGSYKPTKFNYR